MAKKEKFDEYRPRQPQVIYACVPKANPVIAPSKKDIQLPDVSQIVYLNVMQQQNQQCVNNLDNEYDDDDI